MQVVALSFFALAMLVAVPLALSQERRAQGNLRAARGILLAVLAMVAAWVAVIARVT